MRKVTMVVAVLMISCHVSTLRSRRIDGAHTTISRTQKAKKVARLATSDAHPAKRSKNPTRADTSLGIKTEGDRSGIRPPTARRTLPIGFPWLPAVQSPVACAISRGGNRGRDDENRSVGGVGELVAH